MAAPATTKRLGDDMNMNNSSSATGTHRVADANDSYSTPNTDAVPSVGVPGQPLTNSHQVPATALEQLQERFNEQQQLHKHFNEQHQQLHKHFNEQQQRLYEQQLQQMREMFRQSQQQAEEEPTIKAEPNIKVEGD